VARNGTRVKRRIRIIEVPSRKQVGLSKSEVREVLHQRDVSVAHSSATGFAELELPASQARTSLTLRPKLSGRVTDANGTVAVAISLAILGKFRSQGNALW